jgi:hypothetical protein
VPYAGNDGSPVKDPFIQQAEAADWNSVPKITLPLGPAKLSPPAGLADWSDWTLTDDELRTLLSSAGFPEDQWPKVIAIIRAESGGRPYAFNGNPRTGDESYGILQINMKGRLGRDRRDRFSLASDDDLYDPLVNARIAYQMSNGGTNWRPWGGYTNGSYRKFLP